jgi:hypothetical protein
MGEKTQYHKLNEGSLSTAEQKALDKMRDLWKEAGTIQKELSTSIAAKVAKKVKVPAGKEIKISYRFGLAFSFVDPKAKKASGDAMDLS